MTAVTQPEFVLDDSPVAAPVRLNYPSPSRNRAFAYMGAEAEAGRHFLSCADLKTAMGWSHYSQARAVFSALLVRGLVARYHIDGNPLRSVWRMTPKGLEEYRASHKPQ
jgi:hypothetical protein